MKLYVASSVLLAAGASAQQGAWAQCGGQGWSGGTTCIAGFTCIYSNPYYSQCLPGGSTTTVRTSSSSRVSTSSRTSTSSGFSTSTRVSTTSRTSSTTSRTSSATPSPTTRPPVRFAGTNIAGFDFGCLIDGSQNIRNVYPPLSSLGGPDGLGQMQHFIRNDNLNTFRLPVGWQFLLNNNLGGTLDANNFGRYDQLVQACLGTGATCILDLHNYARWNGAIIGQGGPTDEQFASIWAQLATKYRSQSRVYFGLMNEPHGVNIQRWAVSVQAAVNAVRNAGATSQIILLPGNNFASAGAFLSSGSAEALKPVKNPDGTTTNLIFDLHKYLDFDNSGTHPECVTNNIDDAFQPVATWLRANGRQAMLTESGGGNVQSCVKYFCEQIAFLNANSDVYLGYTGWSAGSFSTSYVLSQTPSGSAPNFVDSLLTKACIARPF